jgi:hypothetical protein
MLPTDYPSNMGGGSSEFVTGFDIGFDLGLGFGAARSAGDPLSAPIVHECVRRQLAAGPGYLLVEGTKASLAAQIDIAAVAGWSWRLVRWPPASLQWLGRVARRAMYQTLKAT